MLDRIIAHTRTRIEALPALEELMEGADAAPAVRDFASALTDPGLSVVAEVKRRSPSKGDLALDLNPVEQAKLYEDGGAAAVSVLTEPEFFSGSDSDLRLVRAATGLPVLRKDFTLEPRQVWEARAVGADAVLLIVAVLNPDLLAELLATAEEAGIAALVEVHTETETETALAAGPQIVGVNNRNLETFEVDLATAERIAPMLESVPVKIAESGILTADDAARMRASGYDAVLVGESLVRAADPSALIDELRRV